ncbi:winged helix-turn-helix transcriptional regulator [Cryomorpha ignava]|uniref:Winged helix-turn-helix transcriptional regulator n=1 Tax=Cryomorpha ignava TaxID=101383 RepID=A0A7K3WTV9_9FLAO|nr:SatD family protein [Cryomorpha ignava]NEN24461.1 winged helix-turn-helix transcriptional regulator [Cryomorpha ignava]
MRAVLTGDIIDSRNVESPQEWINLLKEVLNTFGKTPKDWEIYRGDSFQLELDAEDAFKAVFQLKAGIKTIEQLDVRISIGLGNVEFRANAVTLSNGPAFIHSGEAFDLIQSKKQNLILSCDDKQLTKELNIMLQLAEGLTTDWTQSSAKALYFAFTNPGISQIELSKKLGITQPSVSARLRVAHADEIFSLIDYYTYRIKLFTE